MYEISQEHFLLYIIQYLKDRQCIQNRNVKMVLEELALSL